MNINITLPLNPQSFISAMLQFSTLIPARTTKKKTMLFLIWATAYDKSFDSLTDAMTKGSELPMSVVCVYFASDKGIY